jgi:hypothetical protein
LWNISDEEVTATIAAHRKIISREVEKLRTEDV